MNVTVADYDGFILLQKTTFFHAQQGQWQDF